MVSLRACCIAVILGLPFATILATLTISLLNKVSYLPRRHGCFFLVSPTVSLLPHFLMTFKAIPPEVFCETVCEILLTRLRFASLKLSFFYVSGDMCRYRIQDWKLEIIFSSQLWCFASDLFILMLLIYRLMPFWLLTLNEWSILFFWKLLEYSLYNILKFHGDTVGPPPFKKFIILGTQ